MVKCVRDTTKKKPKQGSFEQLLFLSYIGLSVLLLNMIAQVWYKMFSRFLVLEIPYDQLVWGKSGTAQLKPLWWLWGRVWNLRVLPLISHPCVCGSIEDETFLVIFEIGVDSAGPLVNITSTWQGSTSDDITSTHFARYDNKFWGASLIISGGRSCKCHNSMNYNVMCFVNTVSFTV